MANKYIEDGISSTGKIITNLRALGLIAGGIPEGLKISLTILKDKLGHKDIYKEDFKFVKTSVAMFMTLYMATKLASKRLQNKTGEKIEGFRKSLNTQLTNQMDALVDLINGQVRFFDDETTTENIIKVLEKMKEAVAPIPGIEWTPSNKIDNTIDTIKENLQKSKDYSAKSMSM